MPSAVAVVPSVPTSQLGRPFSDRPATTPNKPGLSGAATALSLALIARRGSELLLLLFKGKPLVPFDNAGEEKQRSAAAWRGTVTLVALYVGAAGLAAGWGVASGGGPFAAASKPLTQPSAPAAAVAVYLVGLHALRAHVAALAPKERVRLEAHLQPVVAAHNALLSVWSAALLAAMAAQLLPLLTQPGGGFMAAWCDPKPHALATHPLVGLCYLNYLVKWYELADTAFLVLRGRPTPLLHVFHHAATLVLCWLQLVENTACQWLPIVLNLTVHVLMYGYYAAATLGIRCWWKRYLTTLQIVQFSIGVPSCVAALVLRISAERGWGLLGAGVNTWCRGTHRAAYVGIGLLGAYLLLFLQLYRCACMTLPRASFTPVGMLL